MSYSGFSCRMGLIIVALICPLVFGVLAHAATIYVDATAGGAETGETWIDAFVDLQSALDAAPAAGNEIWIAAGTYYPTAEVGGIGERYRAFALKNDVAVYGGFTGGETELAQRDWQANVVILSGDIGVVDDNSDNSYHVFHHEEDSFLDETAVLDGCTITGGNGDIAGGDNRRGGGMYNEDASPTVANCLFLGNQSVGGSYSNGGGMCNRYASPRVVGCTFRDNVAGTSGGAMVNLYAASPLVIDCVFEQNVAGLESSGLGDGGAVYNSNSCSPIFSGCSFLANRSNYNGGAMYNMGDLSTVTIVDCRFTDNSTGLYGGAIYNTGTDPDIIQSVFNRNAATAGNAHGGVIYNFASDPSFTSCVFYDNESGCVGNGIYSYQFSSPVITNCILQGDDVLYSAVSSDPVVTYCNIQQSGFDDPALHNVAADPMLVDPENDDFRLMAGSPCIDAGDNDLLPLDNADIDGDGDVDEILPLDYFGNSRCHDDPAVTDSGNGTAPYTDMGVHEFGADVSAVPESRRLLLSSYPNPFNPATTIAFDLPQDGPVSLKIFDLQGKLVRVLLDEPRPAGPGEIIWTGLDDRGERVASGVYLSVLQTRSQMMAGKLAIVK